MVSLRSAAYEGDLSDEDDELDALRLSRRDLRARSVTDSPSDLSSQGPDEREDPPSTGRSTTPRRSSIPATTVTPSRSSAVNATPTTARKASVLEEISLEIHSMLRGDEPEQRLTASQPVPVVASASADESRRKQDESDRNSAEMLLLALKKELRRKQAENDTLASDLKALRESKEAELNVLRESLRDRGCSDDVLEANLKKLKASLLAMQDKLDAKEHEVILIRGELQVLPACQAIYTSDSPRHE